MALNNTLYNIQNYQKQPVVPNLGTDAVKRVLSYTTFHIKEFPGLTMRFLPKGVLQIKGKKDTPYLYEWGLYHLNNEVIIRIDPDICEIPADMKVELPNINTVLMTSIEDSTEKLTLTCVNLKSY